MNILSHPVDDGGCGYARVRWPLEAIKRNNLASTLIMEQTWPGETMLKNIKEADVLLCRPRGEQLIWKLKVYKNQKPEVYEELGVKDKIIVFDHDDNTFDMSPYNTYYRDLGVEEVQITDMEGNYGPKGATHWLWKDGENEFNLKENIAWRESLTRILKEADLVTTTTEYLANFFRAFNPNVAVLPNSVDFNMYRHIDIKSDGYIRIGWQGGASHYEDWDEIAPAMTELFEKYGNLKLVLLGSWFKGTIKGIPENRIEKHPWVKTIAHPYHLSTIRFDMAVIPLKDTKFNHCKSELKYTEFSALKVPSVVRNIIPYSKVCKDGVNALCYNNNRELVQQLSNLIENKKLRTKIARNAFKWAKENRDIDKNAHLWVDAYNEARSNRQN